MTTISQFSQHLRQTVSGQYRVCGNFWNWDQQRGAMAHTLHLIDYSGSTFTGVRYNLHEPARQIPVNKNIQAKIHLAMASDGAPNHVISQWEPIAPEKTWNTAQTIPWNICPEQAYPALQTLTQIVDSIQTVCIRHCFNRLLETHHIDLMQAQGGWEYHHAYPGGLLTHTANTIMKLETMATDTHPNNRSHVEILMLCAFIHDLGKCMTTHPNKKRNFIHEIRHETVSISMAIPALEALEKDWPHAASSVASVLRWLSMSQAWRNHNRHTDAQLVHMADVWDVIKDRAARHALIHQSVGHAT